MKKKLVPLPHRACLPNEMVSSRKLSPSPPLPPPGSGVSADEWYLPALPDGSLRRYRSACAPIQEQVWPPPLALSPAGQHSVTPAFKSSHTKAIRRGLLNFFIPGRKLPASPHHGFQLQRHSQTGIRKDTEQEAGGEYRYCCTCCGRGGEGGGWAGGGGTALPVVLGRETGLKWGFFIALLADSSLSPNFVPENISERWQSRDWLIVLVLWM